MAMGDVMNKVEFFWAPPAGERILGMREYQDMIVIATTDGVYVMTPDGRALDDYTVRKISERA